MNKQSRPMCHVKDLEIGMEFSNDEGTTWIVVRTLPTHTQCVITNGEYDEEINTAEFMASPKDKPENSEWKKIFVQYPWHSGHVILNREWSIQHLNGIKYFDFINNAISNIPSAKDAYNAAVNANEIKELNPIGFEVENKIKNVVVAAINNQVFRGITEVYIERFYKDGTFTSVAESCILEFLVEKGYRLMRYGFDLKINWGD